MSEVETPVFAYLFGDSGRVVTLAYTIFRDEVMGSVEERYTAYVGYAICLPEDQHCKAKGRLIAQGRMEKLDSRMEIPLGEDVKRSLRMETIIDWLSDPENTVDQYGGRLLSKTAFSHNLSRQLSGILQRFSLDTETKYWSPGVAHKG